MTEYIQIQVLEIVRCLRADGVWLSVDEGHGAKEGVAVIAKQDKGQLLIRRKNQVSNIAR